MTDRELMQQALEALETCKVYGEDHDEWAGFSAEKVGAAVTALREQLAQPQQPQWHMAGFSTPPRREWVGLTDEELLEVYNRTEWDTVNGWEYERAIEAKLKEKNA